MFLLQPRLLLRRVRWGLAVLLVPLLLAACSAAEESGDARGAPSLATTRVQVAGETLEVEVAADRMSRFRGLSGRPSIPRHGGMLFVLPRPEIFTMVMRDCPNPIDVAFLDSLGRVVATHEMTPEPPRRSDETPDSYERRLRGYASGTPVQFALETAGGLLAKLGLAVGDRVHFDAQALLAGAR